MGYMEWLLTTLTLSVVDQVTKSKESQGALGRMANLKTRGQARVKELAELKLQGLVKLKWVVNDDPKRKLWALN
jgi:hypothetical protein